MRRLVLSLLRERMVMKEMSTSNWKQFSFVRVLIM